MKLKIVGPNMVTLTLDDDTVVLFSYETAVAARLATGDYVVTDQHYSRTTSRHISRWLDGIKAVPVPQSYLDALVKYEQH